MEDPDKWENKALVQWNEQRKEWRRARAERKNRGPRRPVLPHDVTYEDLLATNQPFPKPVPLPEMVDFLIDVWDQEGLYD